MEKNRIKKKELLRFLVGGGSAVVTDYIVYKILLHIGVSMSVSKVVSYVSGAAVGFVINKLWTFESKSFSKAEIAKYTVLYTVSACVNAGINKIVIFIIPIQILAFLCATGASTILNFIGQKFFVFATREG